MKGPLFFLFLVISLLYLNACQSVTENSGRLGRQNVHPDSVLQFNREIVAEENMSIDDFCRRYGWNMVTTKTGLRYKQLREGNGIQAVLDSKAHIRLQIKLLTGETVYETPIGEISEVRIGRRDVVSGLEEGLLMMREGDQFQLIVPSHLAYGLLGDLNRIPERAVLVCKVDLIKVSLQPKSSQ